MTAIDQASHLSSADRRLLANVKHVIQGFLPTATILLYGSVARGTQTPESDYDLLILTGQPIDWREEERIDGAVYDVQLDQGIVFSTILYCLSDWEHGPLRASPLRKSIEREGIIL